MGNLARLVKAKDLPITMRHEKWMQVPDHLRTWSPEALEFSQKVLAGEVGGKRQHHTPYRASGSGKCMRARHFSAEGLPRAEIVDTSLYGKFMTGDFLHLKWQMMGLTEGWLKDAEVVVQDSDGLLSGTMDGLLYDDSIFEFKSIYERGFKNVVAWGADPFHVKQVHAYMYCTGAESASIVYENKNDQDWIEIRVHRDDAIYKEIEQEIDDLNRQYNERTLREPLGNCLEKTGHVYRNCQFRDVCLDIKDWEDIDDLARKKE